MYRISCCSLLLRTHGFVCMAYDTFEKYWTLFAPTYTVKTQLFVSAVVCTFPAVYLSDCLAVFLSFHLSLFCVSVWQDVLGTMPCMSAYMQVCLCESVTE